MAKTLIFIAIALAAFWAFTLWKAARHEARAEAAYPPEGDFVTVDGHRVHYLQKGSGPDLILIHGASGNLRDFSFAMIDRLSSRYRVTAFDRPGLGYTPRINESGATITQQAALLSGATQALGIDRPIVVGHSYGGAVALAWAVHHPERIAALVPVSAPSNPWQSDLSTYYKITSSRLGGQVAVPMLTAFVRDQTITQTIDSIFEPQQPPAGYDDHIGAGLTLRRNSLRANARQRANLLSEIETLHSRYGEITVPTELVHGDADTTVGLSIHSEPLSGQIPGAVLTRLPGIGHMPQHNAADAVDAAIDRAAARAGFRPQITPDR